MRLDQRRASASTKGNLCGTPLNRNLWPSVPFVVRCSTRSTGSISVAVNPCTAGGAQGLSAATCRSSGIPVGVVNRPAGSERRPVGIARATAGDCLAASAEPIPGFLGSSRSRLSPRGFRDRLGNIGHPAQRSLSASCLSRVFLRVLSGNRFSSLALRPRTCGMPATCLFCYRCHPGFRANDPVRDHGERQCNN